MPESTVSGRGPGAARMLVGRVGGVAGSLVAGQVVLGLTYVFAARAITPEALGIVATCFAISVVSATVFDLGLMSYVVRESAGGRLDVAAAARCTGQNDTCCSHWRWSARARAS